MNPDEIILRLVKSIALGPSGNIIGNPSNPALGEAIAYLLTRGMLADQRADELFYRIVEKNDVGY